MSEKKKTNTRKKMSDVNVERAPLLVNSAHYIKDLSFENPGVLKEVNQTEGPALDINIHVDARPLAENIYEVIILLNIKAVQKEDPLFLIELSYGGIFQVDPSCEEADRKTLLLIDAPYLLFPFARSIVASLTRDGGLPPLLLNPVNFELLYQQTIHETERAKH